MLSDLFIPATIDPAKPVFDDELDDEEKEEGNQNLNYTNTNSIFKKKKQVDGKRYYYNLYQLHMPVMIIALKSSFAATMKISKLQMNFLSLSLSLSLFLISPFFSFFS